LTRPTYWPYIHRAARWVEAGTPLEQANPLVFLCSAAADVDQSITMITMITDSGSIAAGVAEAFSPATRVAQSLLGRLG
jgi:hypothetical protein